MHAHAGAASEHHRGRALGQVGLHRAQLGGVAAVDVDQHVAARRAGAHFDEQRLVGLVVHQHVLDDVAAAFVPEHSAAVQRDRVLPHVEHVPAVGRPGKAFQHAADALGRQAPGAQVLDVQVVRAAADYVLGPGQPLPVGADQRLAQAVEALRDGLLRQVQQHLGARRGVGAFGVAAAAHQLGVFQRAFELAPHPPAAVVHRHGAVVGLHARDHLLVQAVTQALQRGQHGLGVAVLGLEVAHHLGALGRRAVVAQPEIGVLALAVGRLHHVRPSFGLGRLQRLREHGNRAQQLHHDQQQQQRQRARNSHPDDHRLQPHPAAARRRLSPRPMA